MGRPLLIAAIAALALAPAAPAAAATPAAAARDWSQVVAETPEGGFRMGNPDAAVKVVEYLSLTCPHCAHFAQEGVPALIRDHVRSGRVSLEYRNFVLNGIDAAASLLARCGGSARFFPMVERMLARQAEWVGRIQALSDAQRQSLGALDQGAQFRQVAELSGLSAIAADHGVDAAAGARCLSDPQGLARLDSMFQAGVAAGIEGTPSFLVNGRKVDAGDWATLRPLIASAGG